MQKYIYIYTYVYIYVLIFLLQRCTHLHTCAAHTFIHIWYDMYVNICSHTHTHIYSCAHIYVCTQRCTHLRTGMIWYICKHIQTHTHIYIYMFVYTYTHTCDWRTKFFKKQRHVRTATKLWGEWIKWYVGHRLWSVFKHTCVS